MRILIFILALMSAFFVSKSFALSIPDLQEPDLSDLKRPKLKTQPCEAASFHLGTNLTHKVCGGPDEDGNDLKMQSCMSLAATVKGYSTTEYDMTDGGTCREEGGGLKIFQSGVRKYSNGQRLPATHRYQVYFANIAGEPTYSCPPDGYEEHVKEVSPDPERGVPVTGDDSPFWCAKPKKPEDCPAGYHSKSVSKAMGSSSCMPNECPSAGSSENLFSSPSIGGAPFDTSGLYCNNGCAYNVNKAQTSQSKYALGVSQGVACGDKPYDNKKLATDADADQCTVSSDGTISLLQCPDHNQPDPEPNPDPDANLDPDPIDNSDSKTGEDKNQKQKQDCEIGDTSCKLGNVEVEIENSISRLMDNDNELHNKKIDADTKNANAILNILESIDTAILLQTNQDERLHAVTLSKFNELVDAVNGIEAGGGGGGGNGTGNGNIGGQDCEGTIEECAGIGSGDGVELPQETRNLDQYAQKYNNWLPDAELPPEKCITLTNGKSLCFSFKYFILFFQAISGLIVLSSLIHSASIIVRSV